MDPAATAMPLVGRAGPVLECACVCMYVYVYVFVFASIHVTTSVPGSCVLRQWLQGVEALVHTDRASPVNRLCSCIKKCWLTWRSTAMEQVSMYSLLSTLAAAARIMHSHISPCKPYNLLIPNKSWLDAVPNVYKWACT